jgi:aminoglycoside phosphotransferase (APT) family kinase protein
MFMEYNWERTFPFMELSKDKIIELFEGVLEEENIVNIIPISEGCRTTNYIIETNEYKHKYILKIFFSKEQNYKREIKLLNKLKTDKKILVPQIYKMSKDKFIQGREYAIYQFIEGKTLGQAINEGYKLEDMFIRDVARSLAKIHSYKFQITGFLDENLNIKEELPPLTLGDKCRERLGKDTVERIRQIVEKNKSILMELDKDVRLVHGDFQGTNILIKDNKLAGILDWEFVMAGHPLADIGQFFRYEEYFDEKSIQVFEDEYNKNSTHTLMNEWYRISKLRDLVSLIQLLDMKKDMPNKFSHIKNIIISNLNKFD